MARPAPADWMYGAAQAKTFVNPVAVDLTNQFPLPGGPRPPDLPPTAPFSGEYCHAVEGILVTSPAGGSLVVRMQADPATNVSMLIPAATIIFIRGLFVQLVSTTEAAMSVTAFWQGGPT